jgi:hypothetical protein
VTTRSLPPPAPYQQAPGPLAECLIALAGTPDDSSWIEPQLVGIAQLAADLVAPVSHASVTAYRDDTVTAVATGATGSDVARMSLSIPLFAGRGISIAALNLYGRDAGAMAALTDAVRAAFDPDVSPCDLRHRDLDPGGAGLVAGIAGAFAVRAVIQQAMGLIIVESHRTADSAYLLLRLRAAETGHTLVDTAAALIAEHQWR